jgi:hypothetical protein
MTLRKSGQPLSLVAACCCKTGGCMTLQNHLPSGGMSLRIGTRACCLERRSPGSRHREVAAKLPGAIRLGARRPRWLQ